MKNNFFNDVITPNALNERFDRILLEDANYIALQKTIDEISDTFDVMDFSKEQRELVNDLICAYTQLGAYFGQVTYQQGFRDCASLFQSILPIESSPSVPN